MNLTSVNPDDIKTMSPCSAKDSDWIPSTPSELIVLLSREYGIEIKDPKEGRKILVDINTIAAYIEQHRTK